MARVKIPVGPQHPALKEPALFMFDVDGEVVVDAQVRLGYNHRGIEKACESRSYLRCIYLIERICGICSHSHTTCFCQGVEELLGLEIPPRARFIRTVVAELERIHSHLLWLGVAGHEVGFDTLFMYTWRDRELVQDVLEMISGNRVNYAINTVGGVRRDLDPSVVEKTLRAIDLLEERTHYYQKVATGETTFMARMRGVGKLSREKALELCAVGPFARASGVDIDVRRDDPYAAYNEIPFQVIVLDWGDVLARAVVRVLELYQSYNIVRYALKSLPDGPVAVKAPRKVPPGEVVSRYEAPRGEDIHYIRSNGTEMPERVKVRAPTLGNLPAVVESLKGGYVADIPITVASIDPCLSCTDRIVELRDLSSGREQRMTWQELQSYGARWHGR
ncbi:MAG: nickel-dependent hydrogenase large subunit [Acetobacteraceae bacterium]|nr:nickel-dependent hydrogenase large subunit [Acetobacteraceae bacterium]